jgi:hypothetical protein
MQKYDSRDRPCLGNAAISYIRNSTFEPLTVLNRAR